jgi:hypothetical protein
MSLLKVVAPLGGLLLSLFAAQGRVVAADQEDVLDQIEARNKAAASAYEAGSFDKMKTAVLKAIALGEKNGLGKDPTLAKTYMLAAVLYVDGLEDRASGLRYFAKALKISPDIKIPSGMGTSPVKSAFKQALADNAKGPEPEDAPAPKTAKRDKSDDGAEAAALEAELEKKAAAADRKRADAEAERRADAEQRRLDDAKRADAEQRREEAEAQRHESDSQSVRRLKDEKANLAQDLAMAQRAEGKERAELERVQGERDRLQKESSDKDRQLADLKAKLQQSEADKPAAERRNKDEKANLMQDIALAKKGEARERGEKDRLTKEGQDKDKQITDLRTRVAQLEKEKPDREKSLADTKGRLQQTEKDKADKEKQLADARARLAQLEKEKPEREKLLADTKSKLQQTEKEKADKERQLADMTTREKNEREAKDKLEKARQYAETDSRERKAREDRERAELQRFADGPDLPARIPEPLYCAVPDEAEAGADLYVHCIPRPDLRAKAIVFYYRTSDLIHYNAAILERSRKGWYSTVVPGAKVRGRQLQYYGEVLDNKEAVEANNGKANSPNVLTLHGSSAKVARGAGGPKLQQARDSGRSR